MKQKSKFGVVIPSFESKNYIGPTLDSLSTAIAQTPQMADTKVVVVDDGSTDSTDLIVTSHSSNEILSIQLLRQENLGRFASRLNGALSLDCEWILFLDSRVRLNEYSLKNLIGFLENIEWQADAVNGLTVTEQRGQFVGLFWEVPTKLFWGNAIQNAQPAKYTPETFDSMPKGTGLLFIRKEIFLNLCSRFNQDIDTRFQSDDTKLLRELCDEKMFIFYPDFSATYVPHRGFIRFARHTFGRGIFFWDSFSKGSKKMRTLSWAVVLSLPCFTYLTLASILNNRFAEIVGLIIGIVCVSSISMILAKQRGASIKSLLSFTSLLPIFVPIYWTGICFGIWARKRSKKRESSYSL